VQCHVQLSIHFDWYVRLKVKYYLLEALPLFHELQNLVWPSTDAHSLVVSSSECIDYFDETSTSLKHILCKHEKGELTYVPKLLFYPNLLAIFSPFYFMPIFSHFLFYLDLDTLLFYPDLSPFLFYCDFLRFLIHPVQASLFLFYRYSPFPSYCDISSFLFYHNLLLFLFVFIIATCKSLKLMIIACAVF